MKPINHELFDILYTRCNEYNISMYNAAEKMFTKSVYDEFCKYVESKEDHILYGFESHTEES